MLHQPEVSQLFWPLFHNQCYCSCRELWVSLSAALHHLCCRNARLWALVGQVTKCLFQRPHRIWWSWHCSGQCLLQDVPLPPRQAPGVAWVSPSICCNPQDCRIARVLLPRSHIIYLQIWVPPWSSWLLPQVRWPGSWNAHATMTTRMKCLQSLPPVDSCPWPQMMLLMLCHPGCSQIMPWICRGQCRGNTGSVGQQCCQDKELDHGLLASTSVRRPALIIALTLLWWNCWQMLLIVVFTPH